MNIEQLDKEYLQSVLDAFIRVKAGELDKPECGICHNATVISGRWVYTLVGYLSQGWDKYSGNRTYPVPYKVGDTDKWTGEYGQLRYELLDFLIEELTKKVGAE